MDGRATLAGAIAGASAEARSHVFKIAMRIVDNPNELKFRRLNAGTTMYAKVAANGGAMLLQALGFVPEQEPSSGNTYWVLSNDASVLLPAAVKILEASLAHSETDTVKAMDTASPAAEAGAEAMDEDEEAQLALALAMSTQEAEHASDAAMDTSDPTAEAAAETAAAEACREAQNDEEEALLARALAMSQETSLGASPMAEDEAAAAGGCSEGGPRSQAGKQAALERRVARRVAELFAEAVAAGADPNVAVAEALKQAHAEAEQHAAAAKKEAEAAAERRRAILTKEGFAARVKELFTEEAAAAAATPATASNQGPSSSSRGDGGSGATDSALKALERARKEQLAAAHEVQQEAEA